MKSPSQVSRNSLRSKPPCVITVRGRQRGLEGTEDSGIVLLLRLPDRHEKTLSRMGPGFRRASDLLAVGLTWPQAGRLQITTDCNLLARHHEIVKRPGEVGCDTHSVCTGHTLRSGPRCNERMRCGASRTSTSSPARWARSSA